VERIGVISDTHGRRERAQRAIDVLLSRGATRIIHLGDVGSEDVLDLLAGIPSIVVFGNCDDDRGLARYAGFLGIEVAHPATIVELKRPPGSGQPTLRVGITHGHLEREVDRLFAEKVDILLHGHTHAIRNDLVGPTRVMNPGALHRAPQHTALLFDTATLEAEWIDVDR